MLLRLYPARYSGDRNILIIIALYGLALLCECLDHQIAALTGVFSGHTVKHVIAALAMCGVVVRLQPHPVRLCNLQFDLEVTMTTIPIPETPPEYDKARIIERPDGFYWQDRSNSMEYGPFPTLLDAVLDMQSEDTGYEPGETLEEAEAEIGMADHIDPETGLPAEDSRPHLSDQ